MAEKKLRTIPDDEILDQLRAATTRRLGEGQAFSRRDSHQPIDSLVALMLSLWGANLQPGPVGIWTVADIQRMVWEKWQREGLPHEFFGIKSKGEFHTEFRHEAEE